MNLSEAVSTVAKIIENMLQANFQDGVMFGNSFHNWLHAVMLFLIVTLLFYVLRSRLLRYFEALAQKTDTKLDDLIISLVKSTHATFYFVVSAYFGFHALTFSPKSEMIFSRGVMLVVIVQSVFWANRAISFWAASLAETRAGDPSQSNTFFGLSFIGRLLIWLLGLLLILDNLGFNISALVTGLGIGGVAVALAVQNVLGDLLASLSIILDKPFVVGDSIMVEQLQGTVENIGLKTTRVRSLSGELIVFSNTDLLKSRIRNYRHLQERRVVFSVHVSISSNAEKLERVLEIVRNAVINHNPVRFDRVHFKEIQTQAFVYEVVYFVLHSDYSVYMNIQQAINLEIVKRFSEENIGFAIPFQHVIASAAKP